jgi:multiple sugar transport system substrate-binding protein
MKKVIVFILVACLCSALWAGGSEDTPEGPVTLRIMSPASDFTDEWIESWNSANPDIQLVREDLDQAKWIADYLSDSSADIINFGVGAEIPYFAKRGMLYDLTDYFDNSALFKDDIDVGGSGAYLFEDSWYGLPKDYNNVTAITYNRELFDRAGLAYPSATEPMTYDEFEALAAELTELDDSIFGTEVHGFWFLFMASDMAYMIDKTLHTDNQTKMNEDPEVRDIWKTFLRWRKEGISSNIENPISGWAGSAFQTGNIGMVQLGYWYGASCASVEGYNEMYGWAPAPIMEEGGKRVTNSLGATGFIVSSQTKYPDQVFEVFEWYMAGAPGKERAETGWGIPPLESLQTLLPYDNDFNIVRKDIALEEVQYMMPPQVSWYARTGVYQSNWKEVENAYLNGEVTEDEAIDLFYEKMNEALAYGKEEVGE